MGDINYKFNATHAAHYAAFAPIAWCIFFGWLILTTQLGHRSEFNDPENILSNITCVFLFLFTDKFTDALEWRGFLISTRISYALYLVQFPVFFFNVGQIKSSVQYGFPYTIVSIQRFFWVLLNLRVFQ
jgi:peptidoglycan/LPS O-acetylase OafA/YrhL